MEYGTIDIVKVQIVKPCSVRAGLYFYQQLPAMIPGNLTE
jgi:hypothetical protein